jgi:hypothetical protein
MVTGRVGEGVHLLLCDLMPRTVAQFLALGRHELIEAGERPHAYVLVRAGGISSAAAGS